MDIIDIFNGLTEEQRKRMIGCILRDIRSKKGISQTHVANTLGYKSTNFIYMVEKGKALIPAQAIDKFIHAYKIQNPLFRVIIFKSLYPDIWINVQHILSAALYTDDVKTLEEGSIKLFFKICRNIPELHDITDGLDGLSGLAGLYEDMY
ncbi:helix-turn-helix domain-containing protein [Desulfoluna butyratoxydans]|uniref:Lambda repressor-like dna-binding domain n=1 Tax=Desulfoluna butyratoxydans TaxID=231438 RepID=A0A4U8YJM0_9BACT|nr:helix-turn-helix transcriptional regulator [Desulfoluna butyratoxydans]VFQ43841.1 lambda repressor-like dna-binding domain [Desulfoluna butyratoxydans]